MVLNMKFVVIKDSEGTKSGQNWKIKYGIIFCNDNGIVVYLCRIFFIFLY